MEYHRGNNFHWNHIMDLYIVPCEGLTRGLKRQRIVVNVRCILPTTLRIWAISKMLSHYLLFCLQALRHQFDLCADATAYSNNVLGYRQTMQDHTSWWQTTGRQIAILLKRLFPSAYTFIHGIGPGLYPCITQHTIMRGITIFLLKSLH